MGVLYARVAGAWVPIAPAGTVIPPAYAGPRDGFPTHARFGNTARPGAEGVMVADNGEVFTIVPNAGYSSMYQRNAAGTGFESYAQFSAVAGGSFVQTLGIGTHPQYGGYGAIWRVGNDGVGQYALLVAGADTYVNATTRVETRIGNQTRLAVTAGEMYVYSNVVVNPGRLWVQANPNLAWAEAHLVVYASDSASRQAHISWHSPGVAPQIRSVATSGERLGVVNGDISAHVPIQASAFEVNSTITAKRDVRPLRERNHIVVSSHDVRADAVPLPDIMSLRPMAFRPKVPALRIVPTRGDYSTVDLSDRSSWASEPEVGILGHEGTRERLGLIAQDVETVIPSAVSHDIDGKAMGIDYAQITVALLDHVQELTRTIETLNYRIAELERVA